MTRPLTPNPGRVPDYEKSLYDQFQLIYNDLLNLKNDRGRPLSSQQIYTVYDKFLNYVHELKLTRKDVELKGITVTTTATDRVIDDIWQLLSLCFVTCGLTKFAPATYLLLLAVLKLLHHLKECQVYTLDDLRPIKLRLEEIKLIIDNNDQEAELEHEGEVHHQEELLLLRNKLNEATLLYKELMEDFEEIPLDLELIYNKLLSLRKLMLKYITENVNVTPNDLKAIKVQLKEIMAQRGPDGKFHSKVVAHDDHKFQGLLNGLLEDVNNLLRDVQIKNDLISLLLDQKMVIDADDETTLMMNKLESLYDQLVQIRENLDNLYVTRRWDLRETDLYLYQKQLRQIEEERAEIGKQIAARGKPSAPPLGTTTPVTGGAAGVARPTTAATFLRKQQILILYLLRRCYSLVYKLLELSEPVSELLQPIHNQLLTVRQCLLELKRVDGLNNLRELYPFQFKLALLDNLREDGKFIINGQIPEGQGTLNALLAECFDIIYELKIELEEKEETAETDADGPAPTITQTNDDTEVETKRNRFQLFLAADYDQDSHAESESDDDYDLSDAEGNDYY